MIFGPCPLAEAEGAILAHTIRLPGLVLKKGLRLGGQDLAKLAATGWAEVVVARLAPGDVPEDAAAARLAEAMATAGVASSRAATGRVNLTAAHGGILVLDVPGIHALNMLDESLTLATLPAFAVVQPGDMLATIKVIPFAVPGAALEAAAARAARLLRLHRFRPLRAGLLLTELPGQKESAQLSAIAVTRARVAALGGTLLPPLRRPHTAAAVAEALLELRRAGAEILLIVGASAVVDRHDVGPAGIVAAGGRVVHFGMPVDPGNLICLGEWDGIPALVLPGCARSPKLNGFDWVLARLFAGIAVQPKDVMAMGVGGLLTEIETRPLPRARAPRQSVAALILAAGASTRMAPRNKLLIANDAGVAMVAQVADAVLETGAEPVLVVTGHQAEEVQAALGGRPLRFVHAAGHAQGLSASLRTGLAALPPEVEGVLVALGDMPLLRAEDLKALLDAFDPAGGRAIVQASHGGQPGNPVIWARAYWPEIAALAGDAGARALLDRHAAQVHRVEIAHDGPLRDFDTPESLISASPR